MAEVTDNLFTLIPVLRCSPYGAFPCRVGFQGSVWELMKGDIRAVAPRGRDAAAVLRLKLERFHREDVLEHANKTKSLDDGALALRPRQGYAPACPSEKGQRCKRSRGLGRGATCFRGLRLSSDSSAAPGIKRPRVQHGLLMWLHGWLRYYSICVGVWEQWNTSRHTSGPYYRSYAMEKCDKAWRKRRQTEGWRLRQA